MTAAVASPFSVPLFRAVWIGTLVSGFGATIQGVGAAWMMTRLSGSPALISLVATSTVLPIMLFALTAGAMADSYDRRAVMIAAQSFMVVVSLALTVCTWFNLLTPYLLLAFTFGVGCGIAFNAPASQAVIGEIVPRPALPSAVAYSSMSFNIARSVGPAIGGVVVAAGGAAIAFLANGLSYLPLILVLIRWRPPRPEQRLPRERVWFAMRAGLRYAAMSPDILRVIPRAALFGIAIAPLSGLMPVIARDQLGGGALTYGLLLGAYGVGSVASGFALAPLRARLSSERLVVASSLAAAVATAIVALSPWLVLSMAGLALAGVGWLLALSTCNTAVQLASPRWVVARTLSLYQMAAFGGFALGAALFGAAAARFGLAPALLAAAAVHVVSVAIGRAMPIIEDHRNLEPLQWQEPDLALPIEGRSGPVVISIIYEIALDDVAKFLELMQERRRVRRRDGARGWTLLRNLGEPNRWVERYDVATWHDYVRHNSRTTLADTANWEAISALHRGSKPPSVTRLIERQVGSLPAGREPTALELVNIPGAG